MKKSTYIIIQNGPTVMLFTQYLTYNSKIEKKREKQKELFVTYAWTYRHTGVKAYTNYIKDLLSKIPINYFIFYNTYNNSLSLSPSLYHSLSLSPLFLSHFLSISHFFLSSQSNIPTAP